MTVQSDVRGPGNWAGKGQPYSRSFAHLCDGAITPLLDAVEEVLGDLAGKQLADVGCGTGTLAARAGVRGARVTGVDPDAEMLVLARAAAPGAALCTGAVPGLPFEPGTFDAVVANFVVNHVGDPRAAVVDLRRVCVPDGVVGVTIWPSERSAISALWADVTTASGVVTPPPQRLPPAKDFERTEPGLAELLTGAGLVRVAATTLTWEFRIDAAALWAGPAGGVGGIGKIVTSQTPAMQCVMRREYERLVSPMVRDGQVVLPAVALLATGQAPAAD